jgi:predicted N-acetyltransferase YhbS
MKRRSPVVVDGGRAMRHHVPVIGVRPARESDVPRILELLSQLFERDVTQEEGRTTSLRRMLDSDRGAVLVAFDDDVVHGVITFSCNLAVRFDTAYAQIEELVVDDAARGKKAGAALVLAAMNEAQRRGCEEMGLYPRETTRGFYEKLGFEYVGVELRQRLG